VLQATAFEFGHGRPLLSDGTWRRPPRLYRQPNLRDFGNRLDGQWRCRHKTNAPQMSRSQPLDTLASSGRVGRAKFRSASRWVSARIGHKDVHRQAKTTFAACRPTSKSWGVLRLWDHLFAITEKKTNYSASTIRRHSGRLVGENLIAT